MIVELGLALAVMSSQAAPTSSNALAEADRNRNVQQDRLVRAGFPPVATQATAFRRLLLSDPYMMMAVPGLEVRRHATGEVDLVVQYPGWTSEPVRVEADVWQAVSGDDVFAAAAPETPVPSAPSGPPSQPPPVCHAWSAVLQDEAGRLASWHGCGDPAGPAGAVSLSLVSAAMATRPDCATDAASPFFAFQRCFGIRPELDDPELEAVFGPLRREWDGIQGARILADTRLALRAPDMRQGDAAWTHAREGVAAVRHQLDQRRTLSQGVARLYTASPEASAGDRYKMSRTMEYWADFTDGQERNYSALLEELLAVQR